MSPILQVVGENVCKRHMKARDLEDGGQMVAVSNGSQPNLFSVAKSINLDKRVNIIAFNKIGVKLLPGIHMTMMMRGSICLIMINSRDVRRRWRYPTYHEKDEH